MMLSCSGRSIRLAACLAVAGTLALRWAPPARAETFTVDTLVDENDGVGTGGVSLRDAINAAEANGEDDTIVFGVTGTITLTVGNAFTRLPNITTNIVIHGPGASLLTISGGGARAILFVDGGTVTLSDLTLADGRALGGNGSSGTTAGGGAAAGMGGAVFVNSGTVLAESIIFSGNRAVGGNGGNGDDLGAMAGGGGGGVGGHGSGSTGGGGGPFGTPGGTAGNDALGDGAGGGGGDPGVGGTGGFGGGGGAGNTDEYGGDTGGPGGFGGGGGGGGCCEVGYSAGAGGAGGTFAGNGGAGVPDAIGPYSSGGGGGGAGLGGAVFVRAGSTSFLNCEFVVNSALGGAGGPHGPNGGQNGQPGQGKGGAIFVNTGASIYHYENIRLCANTASDAGSDPWDNDDVYGTAIVADLPRVVSIVTADPSPTGAESVDFTVRFSENVANVDPSDFVLTLTGTATGTVSTVTEVNGFTYTVTVTGVSGDGTLRLDLVDDGTILALTGDGLVGPTLFVGGEYVIDTPPEVTGIVCTDTNPAPSGTTPVNYAVSFDEDVTGVDAGDFRLVTTDGATATLMDLALVSGSTYSVTVDVDAADCTLRLDLIDNDSIGDLTGNRLGGAGAGNGTYTDGEVYVIGGPSPYVVSIVRRTPAAELTNLSTVIFRVKFSEVVSNVGVPANFVLTTTGAPGGAVSGIVDQGGGEWDVTVDTITGDGTIRLDLIDGDVIVNAGTEKLGGDGLGNGDFTTGEVYTIDQTPPQVVSAVVSGADPADDKSVRFTVSFSEEVTGVGAADFQPEASFLVDGTATVSDVTELSANVYIVTLTGVAGTGALHLEVLDGGISDAAGNANTGAYVSSDNYDPPPYVESITESATSNATSVTFDVTFTEDVSGVDYQLNFVTATTGTVTCDSTFAVSETSPDVYNVTVSTIGGLGSLRLDVVDTGFITERPSGQPLGGPGLVNGDYDEGATHWVDTAGGLEPAHVLSVTRASPDPTKGLVIVWFAVKFDVAVGGVDVGDFALTTTGTASGNVASVTGGGADYNVKIDTVMGDGELGLKVLGAGISPALGGDYDVGQVYTVDSTPPEVVSVTVVGATPHYATTVSFDVVFSEEVTGVDVTDFRLTRDTGVGGALSYVRELTGSVYRATVVGVGGTGTIRLDVLDDDSIIDTATNPLGGGLLANGEFTSGQAHYVAPAPGEALGEDWPAGCTPGAPSHAGLAICLAALGWLWGRRRRQRA